MSNVKDDRNSDQNNDQRLDKILDGALASYTDIEPRAGLEDRILANLRTQPESAQSGWWSWQWMLAGGAALAAVVLMAIMLSPWKTQSQQRESQVSPNATAANSAALNVRGHAPAGTEARKPVPAPRVASASVTSDSNAGRPRLRAVKSNARVGEDSRQRIAAVPHQAVFPSPTGASEQERMLLSYVKRTPSDVLVAMSEEQQQREQEWLDETDRAQKSARKSGSL